MFTHKESLRTKESSMRMHKYKLRTQADTRVRMNLDKEVFFNIFKNISIKSHPKHVLSPLKVSGFHLNSSHSKAQALTCPKID